MKKLLLIIALLTLLGCKSEQAKELLETASREAKILNAKYCAEENAHWREVFITAIRSQIPMYPDGGYCELREIVEDLINVA
jgi:hypothetical protein